MKKIINGKKYDTETAKLLANARNEIHFYEEKLYRKKTGEYFLHGYGGPGSCYAEWNSRDNCWRGGEKILPISFEDAKNWAERKLEAKKYKEIFGKPEKTEKMATYTITIPEDVAKRIRLEADQEKITMSELIIKKFEKK